MDSKNDVSDQVQEHHLFNPRKVQLPPAVEKAMQTKKAKHSNVPVSLLNLPPAPAGMPMTPGSV